MFGKPTSSSGDKSDPKGSARKPAGLASLLASDLMIVGDLTSEGELQIDGQVRGDVTAPRVTLGETGSVQGDVRAERVDIRGKVMGAIHAAEVRLSPTAHVEGDITHLQLTIEAGASFEGRSLKQVSEAVPGADLVMISGVRQA